MQIKVQHHYLVKGFIIHRGSFSKLTIAVKIYIQHIFLKNNVLTLHWFTVTIFHIENYLKTSVTTL